MEADSIQSFSQKQFIRYFRRSLSNKSVAIVGNSPRLLEQENGPLIDSHDVVVRFNDANISGLSSHAGLKTTFRFVQFNIRPPHQAFFDSLEEDSVIIAKPSNADALRAVKVQSVICLDFAINKLGLPLADNILGTDYSARTEKVTRTGFVVLCIICRYVRDIRRISIFGMERHERKKGPLHFYSNNYDAEGDGPRPPTFERMLKNYDKHHVEIATELAALNAIIERHPDLISWY